MITPTVGRVVLVFRNGAGSLPVPALICAVHSDRCINVGGFDQNGVPFGMCSLNLLQNDDQPNAGPYATWMDYQKGQAAKTEALEQELKNRG